MVTALKTKPVRLTATTARLQKQKYCPKHGKRYVIAPGFSLCCYNSCFGGAVRTMMKKSKVYQHIESMRLLPDFHSFVQMHLLAELHEKDKPPVLNFKFLMWKSLMFYASLSKGLIPPNHLPSDARKHVWHTDLDEDIVSEISDINRSATNAAKSSLSKLLGAELVDVVTETVGPVITAHLLGEMNELEVARVSKTDLKTARIMIAEGRAVLQEMLRDAHTDNLIE